MINRGNEHSDFTFHISLILYAAENFKTSHPAMSYERMNYRTHHGLSYKLYYESLSAMVMHL